MKIFYIDIEKFKKKYNKNVLTPYADIEIKTEKRFYEYTIGRYLIKNAAKQYYNLTDTEIIINENGKPVFKNSNLFFSLSHSKDIVIACFDKYPCGIDIEYIKQKNLDKLSKYFKQNFKTQEDFYKYWTNREAQYKLNENTKNSYFAKFQNDYYMSIVSNKEFNQNELSILPYN